MGVWCPMPLQEAWNYPELYRAEETQNKVPKSSGNISFKRLAFADLIFTLKLTSLFNMLREWNGLSLETIQIKFFYEPISVLFCFV